MIKNSVTVEDVVDLLNEALELDRDAIETLVESRVPCNQALADHPSIQVSAHTKTDRSVGSFKVGLLGILNGIFGVDANGWGPIVACFDDNDRLEKFGFTKDVKG